MGAVRGNTSQPERHRKDGVSEIEQVFRQCPGEARGPWRKSTITPDEPASQSLVQEPIAETWGDRLLDSGFEYCNRLWHLQILVDQLDEITVVIDSQTHCITPSSASERLEMVGEVDIRRIAGEREQKVLDFTTTEAVQHGVLE